jgi:hypothetical protein
MAGNAYFFACITARTMIKEYKGPAYAVQTELPEDRTA